jgi:hypothetical protein
MLEKRADTRLNESRPDISEQKKECLVADLYDRLGLRRYYVSNKLRA